MSVFRLWQIAGWTMLHYLWIGATMGAAALVLRQSLRSAAANVRYTAALGSFFPIVPQAPVGIAAWVVHHVPLSDSATPETSVPALAANHRSDHAPSAQPDASRSARAAVPSSAVQTPLQSAVLYKEDSWLAAFDPIAAQLPWLWVFGSPLTFLLTTVGLLGAERLRRASRPPESDDITQMCRRLAEAMRISRRIGVAVCNRIAAPILVGVLRPMILLPAAMAGWSPQQLEMVLLHELAHVRRYDNLVNLLQRLLESAWFFHPMVWLVSGWVRREREHCCDELVVARTRQPQAYAEMLVNLSERLSQNHVGRDNRSAVPPAYPQAVSSMAERPLVARIRRILKKEEQSMQVSRKAAVLVVASLLALAVLIGGYCSLPSYADDAAPASKDAADRLPAEQQETREVSAPAREDSPVAVTIAGKVTDAQTGKPMAKVRVRGYLCALRFRGPEPWGQMPLAETRSDENGAYTIRIVTSLFSRNALSDQASVCVDAAAETYETRPQWLRGYASRQATTFTGVDIALGRGKLVQGTVVDEGHKPVEGALVRIENNWNAVWSTFNSLGVTRTDRDGHFRLWCSTDVQEVISPDPWLRIEMEEYGVGFYWDFLKKDSLGTLVLPRGGTIAGRVVDRDGKPLANCQVWVYDIWPNRLAKARTDHEGKYELKGVPGERVLSAFYLRKNSNAHVDRMLLKMVVYARSDPTANLLDVPRYEIIARDGATVTGPQLVKGRSISVSGRLVASTNLIGLEGLLVRFDYDWENMVPADAAGNFHFPSVPAGKHRLTAYLPYNQRGDDGIGGTDIEVKPGKSLQGVQIQLRPLCPVRVQFVDIAGKALQGITAGATWTKNWDGFWTEGTQSDKDGRAVLYLNAPGNCSRGKTPCFQHVL